MRIGHAEWQQDSLLHEIGQRQPRDNFYQVTEQVGVESIEKVLAGVEGQRQVGKQSHLFCDCYLVDVSPVEHAGVTIDPVHAWIGKAVGDSGGVAE